jgi:PST family polysaccharide transporter
VFPALAQVGDEEGVRRRYVRACSAIALLTFPMMAWITVVAWPLVSLINATKWGPAVPVMRVLAPAVALQSVASTVGVIYLLKARTDVLFWWNLGSGVVIVGSYWLGQMWGIGVIGIAIASALALVLLSWPAFAIPCRLLGIRVSAVFYALVPGMICSLALAIVALAVKLSLDAVGAPAILKLLLSLLAGGVVYLQTVRWLRPKGLEDLIQVVPAFAAKILRSVLKSPGGNRGGPPIETGKEAGAVDEAGTQVFSSDEQARL